MRRITCSDARDTLFATVLFAVSTSAAVAQPERASIAAARIEAAEAPVIDGDLSDPAWARAAMIDQLKQRRPNPGAAATERTVVRIMYDENTLYFGVYAYDSEPDKIVLRGMCRDCELQTGDKLSIILDPGLTRRDAYLFQVGASGGRADSLILNNSEELENWDPIWTARAHRVADGWVAEIAIPFQSLSYDENQPDWGFDFTRNIRRTNEQIQWATQNPALAFSDVSQAGTLTGITGVTQGLGLDVQVYGVARVERDWQVPGGDTGIAFTGGGNLFYRITTALTGTLTFNPDFSDAPLDARQVNTTRFSLFTPETRDFFLQDAAAFEFGGRGFSRGNDRNANNGRPFFSRNIGLVRGQQIGIVGGGKLSGRVGDYGIGALSVITADDPVAPSRVLSALRLTRSVLSESRIGVIFTNGDPTGGTENTVAGADLQYRDSDFLGGDVLQSNFYYERSFSDSLGQGDTFGAAFDSPNEPWGWNADFKQIGENFDPALGFINRVGIREYAGNLQHVTRFVGSFLREFDVQAGSALVTDLHGRLETRQSSFVVSAVTATDDSYELGIDENFDDVTVPFDVAGTVVPSARYHWSNLRARVQSSQGRVFAVDAQLACCGYYGGNSVDAELRVNFRPNERYEIAADWQATFLDLPTGKVDIHVLTLDGTVNFTPDTALALQAQYDNVSRKLGFLARYRWEFAPGDELFAAFGQAAAILDNRVAAQKSLFSVRVGRTLRF